jgi:hypothetical protein
MGDAQVKISKPAVLLTAVLAAAVTACSSSPSATTGKPHPHASGVTAGPGVATTFSSNPVCRQFQKDLNAWKAAVAEPGDAATVLLNASTRPAWVKFGRQLEQLSNAETRAKTTKAARTARELARTAVLVTGQGTEPTRQFTGVQYQRTVTLLENVTSDCTVLPGG